jgi:hypothetical protein
VLLGIEKLRIVPGVMYGGQRIAVASRELVRQCTEGGQQRALVVPHHHRGAAIAERRD